MSDGGGSLSEQTRSMVAAIKRAAAGGGGDPFGMLLLPGPTDPRVIRKAYKRLALALHPDKTAGDKECADAFVLIGRAYERLSSELGYRQAVDEYNRRKSGSSAAHARDAEIVLDPEVVRAFRSEMSSRSTRAKNEELWNLFSSSGKRHPTDGLSAHPNSGGGPVPSYQSSTAAPLPSAFGFAGRTPSQGGYGRKMSAAECEILFGPDHPMTVSRRQEEQAARGRGGGRGRRGGSSGAVRGFARGKSPRKRPCSSSPSPSPALDSFFVWAAKRRKI